MSDLYDVTEHVDGFEPVAQIPLAPPDLVLLDVSLPGLDGPAGLKQLRAHPGLARVPIIALTAHAIARQLPAA